MVASARAMRELRRLQTGTAECTDTKATDHLNTYLNYQAIIIDGTDAEEDYFLLGTRDQFRGTGVTLIELPDRAANRLSWLTKLDATALKGMTALH